METLFAAVDLGGTKIAAALATADGRILHTATVPTPVASPEAVLSHIAATVDSLTVWDHSPLACDFAAQRAETEFPGLRVGQATPSFLASQEPIGLLIVSHVLNELSPEARAALEQLGR